MNYSILFSALQDIQSGLFNHRQSALTGKPIRFVCLRALQPVPQPRDAAGFLQRVIFAGWTLCQHNAL
jgi:hypothetical protein